PATRGVAMDSAEKPVPGLVQTAVDLDMIAARKVQLPDVEPPGHVDVPAADAVLIVGHVVHEGGYESGDSGTGGVGEILADGTARVGEPVGEQRGLGVEQEPSGLAGAGREHHDFRAEVLVTAVGF